MDKLSQAVELLPAAWQDAPLLRRRNGLEEIRLRVGQVPTLLLDGEERALSPDLVTQALLQRLMEKATGASMHTAASALAEGYVSYRGIRIGVCGTAALRDGELSGFRHLSSLAIRIPRECRGICSEAAQRLRRDGFQSTLILGRPGEGKTTALRDLIRNLSEAGTRIGIVDERNELAAVDGGEAQFDLGRCSDVLTGVKKGQGAMMLLRGMNPQILAMDEVTREEDLEALLQVSGCGVGILATAHAADPEGLGSRPLYRRMLEQGVFSLALLVRRGPSGRTYRLERLCA